jgi:hypothetical protein
MLAGRSGSMLCRCREEGPHASNSTMSTPAQSFHLNELATIVRNTCRVPTGAAVTTPNALRLRARELIDTITVWTESQQHKPRLVRTDQGKVRVAGRVTSV